MYGIGLLIYKHLPPNMEPHVGAIPDSKHGAHGVGLMGWVLATNAGMQHHGISR